MCTPVQPEAEHGLRHQLLVQHVGEGGDGAVHADLWPAHALQLKVAAVHLTSFPGLGSASCATKQCCRSLHSVWARPCLPSYLLEEQMAQTRPFMRKKTEPGAHGKRQALTRMPSNLAATKVRPGSSTASVNTWFSTCRCVEPIARRPSGCGCVAVEMMQETG